MIEVLVWVVWIWLWLGIVHCIVISFLATPMPEWHDNRFWWSIFLLGPVGWWITLRNNFGLGSTGIKELQMQRLLVPVPEGFKVNGYGYPLHGEYFLDIDGNGYSAVEYDGEGNFRPVILLKKL